MMGYTKGIIQKYGEMFLRELSFMCLEECGRNLSSVERSVMKRFLNARVRREAEFIKECLEMAETVRETGGELSTNDVDEVMEHSYTIDRKLLRDIRFLPIELSYDYNDINPFRRERIRKQTLFFLKLLGVSGGCYEEIVRKACNDAEYLKLNEEILDLYAEEAYIINSSIRTPFMLVKKDLADRIYCSMLDIGRRLLKGETERIFSKNTS